MGRMWIFNDYLNSIILKYDDKIIFLIFVENIYNQLMIDRNKIKYPSIIIIVFAYLIKGVYQTI